MPALDSAGFRIGATARPMRRSLRSIGGAWHGNGSAAIPPTSRSTPGLMIAARMVAAGSLPHCRPRPARVGGSTFAEDPARDGFAARILWRADVDPAVVAAQASPAGARRDAFDLDRLAPFATIALAPDGREFLALADGRRRLRLDIVSGSLRAGPVALDYRLSGIAALDPGITTLQRLGRLYRSGTFPPRSARDFAAGARLALALRAYDGLRLGASHRDVARVLFGSAQVEADWDEGSLKSRIRRLAKLARSMANEGWRDLLR